MGCYRSTSVNHHLTTSPPHHLSSTTPIKMSSPPRYSCPDSELMALLNPVWFNTYWVKNALELYEGVTRHAGKLDEHRHFFALVQKFSLDAVVLGLCKLFDRSNRQREKDTIPSLIDYLTNKLTDAYVS